MRIGVALALGPVGQVRQSEWSVRRPGLRGHAGHLDLDEPRISSTALQTSACRPPAVVGASVRPRTVM
jgi:hypothetical protein